MIRHEELVHYVATISHALSGPVMQDLQSPQIRELLGYLLILLGRIHTDLANGDRRAAACESEWERLRAEAVRYLPMPPAVASSTEGWEALDAELAQMQTVLANKDAFERFAERLGEDDAAAWLKGMAQWLAAFTREAENDFSKGIPPPVAAPKLGSANELRQRLSTYLKHKFPALPDEPIVTFNVVSGGQSKLSALLTLSANDVLPAQLALRLDIPGSTTTPMLLDTEYPVLKRVFDLGLPVPEPVLFEPEASWLGGAFVLSRQVVDARIAGSPFVEDRLKYGAATGPDFGREAAILLARLHASTYEPALADTAVARERAALIEELSGIWHAIDKTPFTLQRDLALAWLRAHPLPAGRPVCLVHGDYAQHNIMTRDGSIVALLDWELARLADPAEDLAQCKMMLIGGVIEWDEFLAIYREHGGPAGADDPHAIAFYAVLLYLKHGVYQTQMRNKFIGGELDVKNAMIAGHFLDRLALYQAEALRDAIATVG